MLSTIASLDASIVAWVVRTLRAPWLDPLMVGLSIVAGYGVVFLAIGGVVTWLRRGRTVMALWRLFLTVTFASFVAVNVLKPLTARERPYVAHPDVITAIAPAPSSASSMPSGHAAQAVAGAIALTLLWPQGRLLAWLLAAGIAFSRVYLGVHYPTDVLVGGLLGWACAYWVNVGVTSDEPWPTAQPAPRSEAGA